MIIRISKEENVAFKAIEKKEKQIMYKGKQYNNSKELINMSSKLTTYKVIAFTVGLVIYCLLKSLFKQLSFNELEKEISDIICFIIMMLFPTYTEVWWINKTISYMKNNNLYID